MKWKRGVASALCVLLLLQGSSVSLAEGITAGIKEQAGEKKATETLSKASDSEMEEELPPNSDEEEDVTPDTSQEDNKTDTEKESNADDENKVIIKPDSEDNSILDEDEDLTEEDEELEQEEEISLLSAATPSEAVYVSNENELRRAVGTDGTIIVEGTIELSGEEALYVSKGVEVNLQGGKIVGNGGEKLDGASIVVGEGATLELEDIVLDMTNLTLETNGILV